MKALILGGTRFLGIALAKGLIGRGHSVTLFNTGRHPGNIAAGARQVTGDRERDLGRLGTERFDTVIDTCGYLPKSVETSARYFRDKTDHYVFVSSVSAQDVSVPVLLETTPVLRMPEGASRSEMAPQTYGPLKALCEDVASSMFRHRALIVRPGLIAGPHDPTDRFTYWPVRVQRGGTILAPVGPELPVQFIDVRDLSAWIITQAERKRGGTFNVTGPARTITLGDVLATAARVTQSTARIVWASEEFLQQHEVGEWIELPLWVAAATGIPGMTNANVTRALHTGLTIRPLSETIRDTLAWAKSRGPRYRMGAGLDPAREDALIRELCG